MYSTLINYPLKNVLYTQRKYKYKKHGTRFILYLKLLIFETCDKPQIMATDDIPGGSALVCLQSGSSGTPSDIQKSSSSK